MEIGHWGNTRPKVAVFGAGLIGIYIGGLLSECAHVTLIGRPALLEPLDNGLRLTASDGQDLSITPDQYRISYDPSALSDADLILVTVKSMATTNAAAAIAPHARSGATIISFQNGVSNSAILRTALPGFQVLGGMVPFNVAQRGPNHFHRGAGEGLFIEQSDNDNLIEKIFISHCFKMILTNNIEGVQWGKLLINLSNAINALSGVGLAQTLSQRGYRQAWAMCLDEALGLLKATDISLVDPIAVPIRMLSPIMRLPNAAYRYVMAISGGAKTRVDPYVRSSMADDLTRGRNTEIEFLQGEIVRLAERLGKSAPINAKVVELIHAAEKGAPPLSATALLTELRSARNQRAV